MDIKIIKKDLKWARPLTPLNLSKVTAIALHHMEHLTADIDIIHQWHLARGWKGFAYNYFIDFNGNIYECRGLNIGGGLYEPHNDYTISIGFQGHYDISKEMPEAQFNAGVKLINHLKTKIPTITLITGHRYWQPEKTCPGKYFPIEDMLDALKIDEIISKIKDFHDVADWAKSSAIRVVEKGLITGNDVGLILPKSNITREEIFVILDRLIDYVDKK